MILYICPHCKNSSMYPPDLRGQTICRSCGQTFELSQFNVAKPSRLVKATRDLAESLGRAKRSPAAIYVLAGALTLAIVWVVLSVFGFLPDEVRAVHRRFISADDWGRVTKGVGLVGTGVPNDQGEIEFVSYGTAWAIANDGFMVTSKHTIPPPTRMSVAPFGRLHTWVYIDKKRIDANVVWTDTVADLALLKLDHYLPYRFRIGKEGDVRRLNVEVLAIGFQEMPTAVESTVVETELASTKGSISRVFQDAAGTWWMEHTAPLKAGSSGGPLLLGDRVIGLNTKGAEGIYQALNVTVYRDKIFNEIKKWRERQEAGS